MNNSKNLMINQTILDYIGSMQDSSVERKHLYKICNFAYRLEDKIAIDFFKKGGVDSIDIMCQYEFHDGYVLYFDIIDKEGKIMNKLDYRLKKLEQVKIIDSLVLDLKVFEKKFTNFKENICYPLNLKLGISEEVLDLFLSKDLRTIFDYDIMQLELSSENNKTKKIKI